MGISRRNSAVVRLLLIPILGLILLAGAVVPAQTIDLVAAEVPAAAAPQLAPYGLLRQRIVTLNLGALQNARTIPITVFPGTTFAAVLVRIEPTAAGYVWRGRIEGIDFSTVVLAVTDNALAGQITTPESSFVLAYVGGDLHRISEIDPSVAPRVDSVPEARLVEPSRAAAAINAADDGSIIDVLVLYTPSARYINGGPSGMRATAELLTSITNQAYLDSQVIHRIRLVDVLEIAYTETADIGVDLNRLVATNDGFMDAAHAMRNAAGADIVHLITNGSASGVCGIGKRPPAILPAYEVEAFSVTLIHPDCTSKNSFAHELGHNMGLNHDVYVEPGTTPYAYGHGYVNPAGLLAGAAQSRRWYDIMGYPDRCNASGVFCSRIQYFSNPLITYNGDVLGNASTADSVRALNNSRTTVANYRASTPGSFAKASPADGAGNLPLHVTLTWNASQNATGYEYCIDAVAGETCDTAWVSTGTGTAASVTLATARDYFWQVRAIGPNGTTLANLYKWWRVSTRGVAVHNAVLKAPQCAAAGPVCDSGQELFSVGYNRLSFVTQEASRPPEPHPGNTLSPSCSESGGTIEPNIAIDRIKVSTIDGTRLSPGKAARVDVTYYSRGGGPGDKFWFFAAPDAASPVWTSLGAPLSGSNFTIGTATVSLVYPLPVGTMQAIRVIAVEPILSPYATFTAATCPAPGTVFYSDTDDLVFSTTGVEFTDATLSAGSSLIKAVHITELRTRIDQLRAANALSAFVWTDPVLAAGGSIKALHIQEMRTALNAVYVARGLALPVYTDAGLVAGMGIKAVYISELRTAILNAD